MNYEALEARAARIFIWMFGQGFKTRIAMKPSRIAATLMLVAAGLFCCLIPGARGARYEYDDRNRLVEVHFDDENRTWIQYFYDENGNRTQKTYTNPAPPTPLEYTISTSWTPEQGGMIWPSSATVTQGSGEWFMIIPFAGYRIENVTVDGQQQGAVASYFFSNVSAPHTISATFSHSSLITALVEGLGTISPAGATSVPSGANQSYTITPDTGNHFYIRDVQVDGNSVGAIATYLFENVSTGHTIKAIFSDTLSITATVEGAGGKVTPEFAEVHYGDDQVFVMEADSNYEVAEVRVDGNPVGPLAEYTFNNVTTGHTLSAVFRYSGPPVKNLRAGTLHETLQQAYDAAEDGDTLLCCERTLNEDFAANRDISVTIDGGYAGDFLSNPGVTTLAGAPVVGSGTVTWMNFIISN